MDSHPISRTGQGELLNWKDRCRGRRGCVAIQGVELSINLLAGPVPNVQHRQHATETHGAPRRLWSDAFRHRFINLLSMRRFAPRELCTSASLAVACATFFWLVDGGDTGLASAHPLTTDRSSRLNRPCGNWPDTPEYLHGRVLVGHLSVAEVEYPNFSAARRSRRLTCRQDTDRRPPVSVRSIPAAVGLSPSMTTRKARPSPSAGNENSRDGHGTIGSSR